MSVVCCRNPTSLSNFLAKHVQEGCGRAVDDGFAVSLQMALEEFWQQFLTHMQRSMIVYKREPAVERTIDFISKFATAVPDKDQEQVQ